MKHKSENIRSDTLDSILQQFEIDSADKELDLITFNDVQVACQRDMSRTVKYEQDYWQTYVDYRGTEMSKAINDARVNLIKRYCKPQAKILDIGIGSGEFIEKAKLNSFTTHGYDVNNIAKEWLQTRNIWYNIEEEGIKNDYDAITMWDVMEHMKNPSQLLSKIASGTLVFISIPCFENFHPNGRLLQGIKKSKHYRPNEHYYYFSTKSLCAFMKLCGFETLEMNLKEIEAGRVDIYSFAFKKM
jgi:hypothetical protein